MSVPLRIAFDVACSSHHAFDVWTTCINTWWPPDHTVSGDHLGAVVLEAELGGRIYERSTEGIEHEWGVVTTWDPPTALGYKWHIGRSVDDATDVLIGFVAKDSLTTRVEIEHSGWERLGTTAELWRDRNRTGWETLVPHFVAAMGKETSDGQRNQR